MEQRDTQETGASPAGNGPADVPQRRRILHWPAYAGLAVVVLLAIAASYILLAEYLPVVPEVLLGVLPLLFFAIFVLLIEQAHRRGDIRRGRRLLAIVLFASSGLVSLTALGLVLSLGGHYRRPIVLLAESVAIWWANTVLFAVWYWEVDSGGPHDRLSMPYASTDFAFPQVQLDDAKYGADWTPNFIDYLFLAFNTSTAFSPSDTIVLSRRAKLLMMWQSGLSLTIIAGLAARAIGTI